MAKRHALATALVLQTFCRPATFPTSPALQTQCRSATKQLADIVLQHARHTDELLSARAQALLLRILARQPPAYVSAPAAAPLQSGSFSQGTQIEVATGALSRLKSQVPTRLGVYVVLLRCASVIPRAAAVG